MKRKLIAVVLAATLALVLVMPTQAAVTTNLWTPVSASIPNACVGEWIDLEGEIHWVTSVTWDETGGYHVAIHVNRANVKGTGQSSGAKYIFNGGKNDTYNVSSELPPQEPWERTVVIRQHMVGTGGANSGTLYTIYHVTFNANGELTVVFTNAHFSCK